MPPTNPAAPPAPRHDRLDALRGLAMLWMTAFHAAFDFSHYGLITHQDFYRDPFWTLQRTAIVTLFLCCAGLGQAVALQQQLGWARFLRRWGQVAGAALLVSLGSAWMFPLSWISFGVLHGLALMLLLARAGGRWPAGLLLAIAIASLLLPQLVAHPFFDTRWTNWVGLVTHKPRTEDYVPLLPWFGVLLLGLLGGRWLLAGGSTLLSGALLPVLRPLALLGRWSLSYYLLHQPVLIGLCLAVLALRP